MDVKVQTALWNGRAQRVADKAGFVEGGGMNLAEAIQLPDRRVIERIPTFVLPGMPRVEEGTVFRRLGREGEG